MNKWLKVLLIVLLASLVLVPAAAAAPAAGPHIRAGRGFVTAKTDTTFTVFYNKFLSATFLVNEQTLFFDVDGAPATFADLTPGMKVGVRARLDGVTWIATEVRFLRFVARPRILVRGEVTAKGDTSFDVHAPVADFHFAVDGDTVYHKRGGATFADVTVGAKVLVLAAMQADGSWLAKRVGILPGRAH